MDVRRKNENYFIYNNFILTSCYVDNKDTSKGYNLLPAGTANDCCCDILDSDEFTVYRWICSNSPYERGECLPSPLTTCKNKNRNNDLKKDRKSHNHRHRHNGRFHSHKHTHNDHIHLPSVTNIYSEHDHDNHHHH